MGSADNEKVWAEMQASAEFQDLKRRFRRFAFPLTVAFLLWYFLYVALTAFAREWVSTPVIGNINIAFILGVLQFVTTFVIMWLYERYSTNKLDALSEELRERTDKELAK
ncbi:MAG: DUF485 domain-containing protein [Micrococcales bacterium]